MAKGLTPEQQRELLRRLAEQIAALDDQDALNFDTLRQLSLEELTAYLELNGVTVNLDAMRDQVEAALGPDLKALQRGEVLDEARLEQLDQRIARITETIARTASKQVMRSQRQTALEDADGRPPSEQIFMWVARLRRSCRSCEERHGQLFALDQWEAVGKPGDGTTLCGMNCECSLLPVPQAGQEDTRKRVEGVRPDSLRFPR